MKKYCFTFLAAMSLLVCFPFQIANAAEMDSRSSISFDRTYIYTPKPDGKYVPNGKKKIPAYKSGAQLPKTGDGATDAIWITGWLMIIAGGLIFLAKKKTNYKSEEE